MVVLSKRILAQLLGINGKRLWNLPKEVRFRAAILNEILFLEEGNCLASNVGSLPLHSCRPSKQHVRDIRFVWVFTQCMSRGVFRFDYSPKAPDGGDSEEAVFANTGTIEEDINRQDKWMHEVLKNYPHPDDHTIRTRICFLNVPL